MFDFVIVTGLNFGRQMTTSQIDDEIMAIKNMTMTK